MNSPSWTEEDTLLLIDWCANEKVIAIKAQQYTDAKVIQRGVTAIMDAGLFKTINDSRLNKWLDFRLSEISYSLRDKQVLDLKIVRSYIIHSLALLINFLESLPEALIPQNCKLSHLTH
jgi:hypothetical protein